MAAEVCRLLRERRCPDKPDICELRRDNLLQDQAPVAIVPFNIFTRLCIPQYDNTSGLQKWHPTLESLPRPAWRLIAIEQEQIDRKLPSRGDFSGSPLVHLYPATEASSPDIRFEVSPHRPAAE